MIVPINCLRRSEDAMEWRIPLADLDYGPEEAQAVLDVIQRRWLTMGAVTTSSRAPSPPRGCETLVGGLEWDSGPPFGMPGRRHWTRR